jgi:hypothetical protein
MVGVDAAGLAIGLANHVFNDDIVSNNIFLEGRLSFSIKY